MIRATAVLTFFMAVISTAMAFVPAARSTTSFHSPITSLALADEDTDFDAPVINNPVLSGKALTRKAGDHDPIVDDECYLGKYGQYDDCVDYDPMHNVDARTSNDSSFEMPDFSKLADEIGSAIKDSPLGKLLGSK
mmetsp:Transcript_16192/g.32574  ORF Transcript_16192/g.32574 Transcript_16192/m.32574 type:complete len:136 (-) Transcript_16192:151-558(-)